MALRATKDNESHASGRPYGAPASGRSQRAPRFSGSPPLGPAGRRRSIRDFRGSAGVPPPQGQVNRRDAENAETRNWPVYRLPRVPNWLSRTAPFFSIFRFFVAHD